MADVLSSSFRDPSGFLFLEKGILYRQINPAYKNDYEHLMHSGLYTALTGDRLLIPHQESDVSCPDAPDAFKTIQPEPVPFISYPYEWSFSQLKHAALTTLEIQKKALAFDMVLKDSSAYNIQFMKGKPLLIDTLSFKKYTEGEPWIAYRQFCQHFLAPLALMSHKDIRLNQLLKIYMDGIPLDLASALLPFKTRFHFTLLSHIHMHAKSQQYYNTRSVEKKPGKISRLQMRGLIDNLESAIQGLKWQPENTEWADYYNETNYSSDAFLLKKKRVEEFLDKVRPKTVWDLGGNVGLFSRIASERGINTLSFDIDPAAVEINYLKCTENCEENLLPLVLDLTNPSPGIGWANRERDSVTERGPADMAFALALIHHLAISNNVPFSAIARYFSRLCDTLVIEFVPKHDSQVSKLFSVREDIFTDYHEEAFRQAFNTCFSIEKSVPIEGTERSLYLMKNRKKQ